MYMLLRSQNGQNTLPAGTYLAATQASTSQIYDTFRKRHASRAAASIAAFSPEQMFQEDRVHPSWAKLDMQDDQFYETSQMLPEPAPARSKSLHMHAIGLWRSAAAAAHMAMWPMGQQPHLYTTLCTPLSLFDARIHAHANSLI
jgi:hypothetical protein